MFPNGLGIVGGEREKFFDLRPVEQIARSKNLHADGDLKIGGRALGILFVVMGGKEVKGFGSKSAFGSGLPNPCFAKENRLLACRDGLTNGGEFFKSLDHGRRTWETMRG